MGYYTENILKLSLTDLIRNIEHLEARVAEDKKKAKRCEEWGRDVKTIEAIRKDHQIRENKLAVNLRALDAICNAAAEEIEQLKREGKWFCEEK